MYITAHARNSFINSCFVGRLNINVHLYIGQKKIWLLSVELLKPSDFSMTTSNIFFEKAGKNLLIYFSLDIILNVRHVVEKPLFRHKVTRMAKISSE